CEAPVQLVAAEANASVGHAPEDPVQVSGTSHWPAEARQVKLDAWKTSTHVLAPPEQWSAASLSHPHSCEAPVQLVALEANTSVGHAPDDPVHVSATSHWPAEFRQVNADDWKTSTQVLAVPKQ